MTQRQIIDSTMQRVRMVHRVFGTVTDKHMLRASFFADPEIDSPTITNEHLIVFRRIVSTGVLKNRAFSPPNGYRILDFLKALQELQERQQIYLFDKMQKDLTDSLAIMWKMRFERLGSIDLAKEDMKKLFPTPDESTSKILNDSYLKAKKQWMNRPQ